MIPSEFLKLYEPSRDSALNYFRARIDESMLREISKADRGRDAHRHFEAMIPIWKEGRILRFPRTGLLGSFLVGYFLVQGPL